MTSLTPRQRLAAVALFAMAGAVSATLAVYRAVAIAPLDESTPLVVPVFAAVDGRRFPTEEDVESIVAADPFGTASDAGSMDSDSAESAASRALAVQSVVRVVGTVGDGAGGGFAMLAEGNQPARIVRRGEKIAQETLMRVDRAQIVLVNATGATRVVKVQRPGESP